jgi:hypothetical protein
MDVEEPESSGVVRWFRAGLLALLGWMLLRLVGDPGRGSPIDVVNLPFHEAGHVFLRPFGHTMHVLGGTIFQLLIPIVLAGYFLVRRRSPFAAAVCLWWLGESLVNVSTYMADARDLALPLVGGGEHDWNELFFRFHLLDADSVTAVSARTRRSGFAVMLTGLAWGILFVLPRRLRSSLVLRLAGSAPWAIRFFEG